MWHKLTPEDENHIEKKDSKKGLCWFLWLCGFLLLLVGAFSLITHLSSIGEQNNNKLDWLDDAMNSRNTSTHCNYEKIDLKNIMEGIAKILDFVKDHLDGLIIDSAIGIRILEAQLNLFQLGHSNLHPTFQALLTKIKVRSKNLSDAIIDKLISSGMQGKERQQLNQNLYWVNDTALWESPSIGNWQLEDETDLILLSNPTAETILLEKDLVSEEDSDKCTHDINRGCYVSTRCVGLYSEKLLSKYSLTHQIFFYLFAKKRNCFGNKNFRMRMGKGNPEEFMHRMCSKVWNEANASEKAGFLGMSKDLLAEQVLACSLMGHTKFLKLSWLKAILSWQSEIGCYAVPSDVDATTYDISNQKRKVKRSDKLIEIGDEKCLAHFTSVALSAMAMHLRYFGDTCLVN